MTRTWRTAVVAVAVAAAVLAPFAVAAEEVTGARSLLVGGMPGAEAGPGGGVWGGGGPWRFLRIQSAGQAKQLDVSMAASS